MTVLCVHFLNNQMSRSDIERFRARKTDTGTRIKFLEKWRLLADKRNCFDNIQKGKSMQIDSHTHPYTHGQYALVYTVCHAHKKKKLKKICGLFLTTHTHVHSCISLSELQIPYKLTGWRRVSEEQHRTSNCSHGSVKTGGQNRSFSSQKRCL